MLSSIYASGAVYKNFTRRLITGVKQNFRHDPLMKNQRNPMTAQRSLATPRFLLKFGKPVSIYYNARRGGVAERFKAPVLKTGEDVSPP